MYTSGTTGLPKGVMHTHSTALWAILTIDATADQHFADRYLVALPLFHVGALTPGDRRALRRRDPGRDAHVRPGQGVGAHRATSA